MSSATSPSPSERSLRLDFDAPVPATWALVVLVVAVHFVGGLYQATRGFDTVAEALIWPRSDRLRLALGGQDAGMISAGDAHQLWTSVLVHTDLLHLTTNAIALFALGRLLEPLIGGRRVWAWFWLGGVMGSLSSWGAGTPQSDGASGGAFALLGVALVVGSELRPKLVPEDARLVGPVLWGFTALNLVLSVVLPFVDLVAHLGGLMAGLLLGGAIGRKRWWPVVWVEWGWLAACAVLVALGWFVPDVFREHFWNVWMMQDPWVEGWVTTYLSRWIL